MIMADHNGLEVPVRKESNCVRCRNHGLKTLLRGHKQYCPYASCACDKCRFTAEQQRQMRLQNAIRRAEAAERSSSQRRSRNSAPSLIPTPQQQTQQIVVTVQNTQPNGTSTGRSFKILITYIFYLLLILQERKRSLCGPIFCILPF